MRPPDSVKRRSFLQQAAAAAVGATAVGCGTTTTAWRFFTPAEARTLEAMCDCIIPADQDPGARQAGVVNYIDRQLTGVFRPHRQAYRDGIAAAARLAGGEWSNLPSDRQAEALRQLERSPDTRPFFDLLVAHSMQGFYGSPRHGGNRDFVSWRMLRLPLSPNRGRNRYQFKPEAVL